MVVTGGSRGIGREIVLGALARGACVAYCARNIDEPIRTSAGQALGVRADISQEDDVEALFDATLDSFGRVDVVVNNAGINHDDLVISMSPQGWDSVIATNLTGSFLVARRAIKEYVSRGIAGRIISISSVAQNGANSNAGYATSKGGLIGLTRAIAQEYGYAGIRAHAVVSGFVDTELTRDVPSSIRQSLVETAPQKRAAKTSEIASVVLFLAARNAWVANGEPIFVSGGLVDAPVYAVKEQVA